MKAIIRFFEDRWYFLFPEVSNLSPLDIKILIFFYGLRKRIPLPTISDVRCEFLNVSDSVLDDRMVALENAEHAGYIEASIHRDPKFPRTVFSLTEKGRKELQRCGHL